MSLGASSQPRPSGTLCPPSVSNRWPGFLGTRYEPTLALAKAWSKACRSSDALYTLCFRTYDAGTVSRSTAGGLLYAATACGPWIVREASPPAPRPPRLLDRVREAIGSRHYYLPVVLTRDETRAVLQRLNGVPRIMALLLYGAGLRLLAACERRRLRSEPDRDSRRQGPQRSSHDAAGSGRPTTGAAEPAR